MTPARLRNVSGTESSLRRAKPSSTNVAWQAMVQASAIPVHRCQAVSRSMPSRWSSHGSLATRTTCTIITAATCRPKNFATVSTSFRPAPAVKKVVSTIARWASTAPPSTSSAFRAGRMAELCQGRTDSSADPRVIHAGGPLANRRDRHGPRVAR